MKEKTKNIVAKVRKAVKEFRIMLADDLIDEAVLNERNYSRDELTAKCNKATVELLKTIVDGCPKDHFLVFAKERFPVNINDGLEAFYKNPTVPHVCAEDTAPGLAREAFPEAYTDIYIINPECFPFHELEDYVKNIVNHWDTRQIVYFEYITFPTK